MKILINNISIDGDHINKSQFIRISNFRFLLLRILINNIPTDRVNNKQHPPTNMDFSKSIIMMRISNFQDLIDGDLKFSRSISMRILINNISIDEDIKFSRFIKIGIFINNITIDRDHNTVLTNRNFSR